MRNKPGRISIVPKLRLDKGDVAAREGMIAYIGNYMKIKDYILFSRGKRTSGKRHFSRGMPKIPQIPPKGIQPSAKENERKNRNYECGITQKGVNFDRNIPQSRVTSQWKSTFCALKSLF